MLTGLSCVQAASAVAAGVAFPVVGVEAGGVLLGVGVVEAGVAAGEEGAAVEEEGGKSSTLWYLGLEGQEGGITRAGEEGGKAGGVGGEEREGLVKCEGEWLVLASWVTTTILCTITMSTVVVITV